MRVHMNMSRAAVSLSIALGLIGFGGLVSYLNPRTPRADARPNVVIVLIDTLRADALPAYGQPLDTAPFLTRLASESAVFEHAYSTSSWTPPSVASIFTSLYPFEHGVKRGFFFDTTPIGAKAAGPLEMNAMPEDVPTLPELFQRAGYATAAISTNRNVEQEIGFRRGFDRFEWHNNAPADSVYALLKRWKREMPRDRPHLIYVHLMDPHGPYVGHAPYVQQFRLQESDHHHATYLSEVRFMDRQLARIFRLLSDPSTIFVVVTDHGEEFRDHGGTEHGPQLYAELNRAAMLIHAPRLGVAAQRVTENVSQIDLLPTLLDAAGLPLAGGRSGMSLWPILARAPGEGEVRRSLAARTLFAHRSNPRPPYEESWAALHREWKYIEHAGRDPELFNRSADPGERNNLAAADRDRADSFAAAVAGARHRSPVHTGRSLQVSPDQELIEQLKALGYAN